MRLPCEITYVQIVHLETVLPSEPVRKRNEGLEAEDAMHLDGASLLTIAQSCKNYNYCSSLATLQLIF